MKTFIINMSKTPTGKKRRHTMQQRCKDHDIHPLEFIEATDGKTLGKEDLDEKVEQSCASFLCTPSMIGCAMSHKACWQRIIDDNLDYALILEDDAVLLPGFKKGMEGAVAGVPKDFHMLLLGCFMCSPTIHTLVTGTHGDVANAPTLRKVKMFSGGHAYIVSQAGARYLVDQIPKIQYHIDLHMSLLPGVKRYGTKKNLSIQEDMSTSSMASSMKGYPYALNTVLSDLKDPDNISATYYLNVPFARIGTMKHHVPCTLLLLLFLGLGMYSATHPGGATWIVSILLADLILFAPHHTSVDISSKLAVFGLGYSYSYYSLVK